MSSPVWAQNPFNIDGTVPDAGATEIDDPEGSLKELGPVNGNTTKIGVIHTAAPPMLAFTNPNGQTDLVRIWLDTAEAADGDVWLYFAWQRDANSGSSVITYEFHENAFPAACDFDAAGVDFVEPISPAEAALIASCNPWAGRQEDDFLIVWDFQGGSTTFLLRTFTGTTFNVGVTYNTAALNSDSSRGEGAINLTDTIFGEDAECDSFASVITGTVTGNSDSADYKDTVFTGLDGDLMVSNCGTVIIRKVADPDEGTFDFTHNLDFIPPGGGTTFSVMAGGDQSFTNVVTPAEDYYVEEDDPSPYTLTDIDCDDSSFTVPAGDINLATGRVTFDLDRGDTLDCTFTNTLLPTVTLTKVVQGGGPSGSSDFSLTQDGDPVDSGETITHAVGDEVVIDEGDVDGYEFIGITGDKCPSVLGGSTDELAAGDNVECTITNALSPKVTLYKALEPDTGANLNSFGLTQNGNGVDSGETVTHSVGDDVTIDEDGRDDYEFVRIDGDEECPDELGEDIVDLAAGDDIECTIVNTRRPTVTVVKVVLGGDADPDDFDLTQDGDPVLSGVAEPHSVGDTVVIDETQQPGYVFVSIEGDKCPDALGGATDELAGGDEITCTITNELQSGAIRIVKTRKFAGAEAGNPLEQPHEGVTFEVSGVGEPLVTDASGLACVDGLAFGEYTVTEDEPDGYVAVQAEKMVEVDESGTCGDDNGETGNAFVVEFHNIPLTDVSVSATAQDPDATRSRINCYEATREGNDVTLGDLINAENTTFEDPAEVDLDDLGPNYPDGLIVCTIEIDP